MPRDSLLEYVSRAPPPSHRVYCTLIPSSVSTASAPPSSSSSATAPPPRNRHPMQYTLYVEHMGNLIPVLEATRRSSKLRPSFTISLPSDAASSDGLPHTPRLHPEATSEDSSLEAGDSQSDTAVRCVNNDNTESHNSLNTESGLQLAYKDDDNDVPKNPPNSCSTEGHQGHTSSLTSSRHVAEVSSHIIASKFRIQSVNHRLPPDMGTITIKTSFLHIQPRKVIVHLPPQEPDSGVESDVSSDDSSGDESDVFAESELSLDSLSSMEELGDSSSNAKQPSSETNSSTVSKTPSNYHRPSTLRSTATQSTSLGQGMSSVENNVVIHSKTPTWNEQHMIYQLDFGGRVTTKSAKNFQLEMDTEQVRAGIVYI